ncbi:hypothetical protein [Polaromonas hydrogenivorans]|uniref:Uncharacterized protein n=1 Tax=Polaromonas hydrogenivorans TaxID=335476 RepID=A0AAU7LTP4_9BURK
MNVDLLQALCALTVVLLPLALAGFVVWCQGRRSKQRLRRRQ